MLKPNLHASSVERDVIGNGALIVGLQLTKRHVIIVGGGREASTRLFFALDAGALVTLISPTPLHETIQYRLETHPTSISWLNRRFVDEDLDLKFPFETSITEFPVDVVLTAIDDVVESRRIARLVRGRRIPLNCADIPELCDFYFMATFRQDNLQIGVSTQGGGPRLAARIRNSIVESLDPFTPKAVTLTKQIRQKIRDTHDNVEKDESVEVLQNRMKWITSFCDLWSMEELSLVDEVIEDLIVEEYSKGREPPSYKAILEKKLFTFLFNEEL